MMDSHPGSYCRVSVVINFHKARASRHTSALSRYNARSLRHQYQRAQFTIHFIKEIKKTCFRSSYIIEFYKHLGFFKNTQEVRESVYHFSLILRNRVCLYNPMHSARFLFKIV